ncbi:MAG: hypothetical protein ACXVZR_15450 [Terriglobales bacterium]
MAKKIVPASPFGFAQGPTWLVSAGCFPKAYVVGLEQRAGLAALALDWPPESFPPKAYAVGLEQRAGLGW